MRMLATLKNRSLNPVEELRSQIDRVFEDAFCGLNLSKPYEPEIEPVVNWYPSIEAYEENEKYVIKAALPGVEKDQINIDVEENRVTISGEHKKQNEVSEENYYRSEISYGNFRRSFGLAKGVDPEKAKAEFKNGILKLDLPKKEEEKAKVKKVKIN